MKSIGYTTLKPLVFSPNQLKIWLEFFVGSKTVIPTIIDCNIRLILGL
jgi:hypothetical protein